MDPVYPRFAEQDVRAALADTPAVVIIGPRQSGKTTLARRVGSEMDYLTLDEPNVLDAARADPVGLVRRLDRAVIDEIQRAPGLLPVLKQAIDGDRRPGRFLLTGSANVMTLPTVSESLSGRVAIVPLLPLSRAELLARPPTFLAACFGGGPPEPPETLLGDDLLHAALCGGYPDALRRPDPERRRRWCRDYVQTIVQRDVRDIATIHKLADMPRLVEALAHLSGNLMNAAGIGGDLRMHHATVANYTTVLEQLFLVERVQPWFRNELKRLVKTPKLHFLDTGLLAAMRGLTVESIARDRTTAGPLLETFVFAELRKQVGWAREPLTLLHFLDKEKHEVDFVVENGRREIVGVEVKAAATVGGDDFRGLKKLRETTGDAFKCGVLLHDGDRILPRGDRLWSAPFPSLWG